MPSGIPTGIPSAVAMPPAPTPPGVQPMRMPQRVVAPPNSTDMASRLASAAAKGVAAAKGDASLRALLTRNGLASYAPVFENEEVDMGSFILFDGADLEDIGITDPNAKFAILRLIEVTSMSRDQ
jgi:hypothetical protein